MRRPLDQNNRGDAVYTRRGFGVMALGVAALLFAGAARVHADPITVPGTPPWYEFTFDGAGSFATSGTGDTPSDAGNSQYAPNPPWTFTSATPVHVTLTDAFLTGDTFTLFDNNVNLGTTPSVPTGANTGAQDVTNPDVTSASPQWSHAVFTLPAGSHSLTIQSANSPFGAGAAFFEVTPFVGAAVPEPSTFALFALGGLGLAGWRRWRKRVSA
jgi:PEP-CTERM motif-containing protein